MTRSTLPASLRGFSLLFVFLVTGLLCEGQPAAALQKIMQDQLQPAGTKPVHSIQVYLAKGDVVFKEAVGFADGHATPADPDNQFKIASITKMMTAVVILQLQEEGRLRMEEPVATYLHDVQCARVNDLHYIGKQSYGSRLTLRQLLQHKSGLADLFTDAAIRFYASEFLRKQQAWSPEKLMNRYYDYHLNRKAHFAPDSGYYYSDVNYFLLGLVIEKISGQTLAQQFRQRVFEPLQLRNTYFEYYEPAQGNGKMAHSFLGKRDITATLNTSYDWAGGGVVSTTADLAAFLRGLFGGKLYQNDSTLKAMMTMQPHTLRSGRVSYYGLGLYQYPFGGDVYYGHGGFWGSLIAYCPTRDITFCGSVNQVNPGFSTTAFITTLLQRFTADTP